MSSRNTADKFPPAASASSSAAAVAEADEGAQADLEKGLPAARGVSGRPTVDADMSGAVEGGRATIDGTMELDQSAQGTLPPIADKKRALMEQRAAKEAQECQQIKQMTLD